MIPIILLSQLGERMLRNNDQVCLNILSLKLNICISLSLSHFSRNNDQDKMNDIDTQIHIDALKCIQMK